MHRLCSLALILALVGAPAAVLGEQKQSGNPDISVGTCIEHGGADEQPAGSPIRTCCMDSDITGIRGCYICDYKWENCVWDPAYSDKGGKPVDKGQLKDHLKPEDLAPLTTD